MAWELLFKSDSGLFSLFVIGFTIVMAIVFARFFSKKMNEDAARAAKGKQP